MTEMKKTIIKKFIDKKKTLLFYGRYVDDTLVVIKREHLKLVYDALNNFGKNLNLIFDIFDNVAPPHFLDIESHPDGLTLYFIKLKNGQTYFKNLTVFTPQDF